MEAPVPASALIHSATLVSAGIYLMMRFSANLSASGLVCVAYQVITAFTAAFGAVVAAMQTDVKKILAYSTISHCGLLLLTVAWGNQAVTLFYLFAHGVFKSLSFVCVGNFIQYAGNYQDVARMGGFGAHLRAEMFLFLVAVFNLSSAPLFLAFFSKHWVLGLAEANEPLRLLCVALVFVAAACGFLYSSRLVFECLFSSKRAWFGVYKSRRFRSGVGFSAKTHRLGLAAICGLLVLGALAVLFLFYRLGLAEGLHTFAASSPAAAPLGAIAVQAWIALLIAGVAGSYVQFKHEHASGSWAALTLLIGGLIAFVL